MVILPIPPSTSFLIKYFALGEYTAIDSYTLHTETGTGTEGEGEGEPQYSAVPSPAEICQ